MTQASLSQIRADLSYPKSRMEGLPSTWALVTTVVAGNLGLAGLIWAIFGRR